MLRRPISSVVLIMLTGSTICIFPPTVSSDQLQVGMQIQGIEFDKASDLDSFAVQQKTVVFVFASW